MRKLFEEVKENKEIFWYGLKARIKLVAGWWLIIEGLFVFIGLMAKSQNTFAWVSFICFGGLGIFNVMKGREENFVYQRLSGNIIHEGQGWNQL